MIFTKILLGTSESLQILFFRNELSTVNEVLKFANDDSDFCISLKEHFIN